MEKSQIFTEHRWEILETIIFPSQDNINETLLLWDDMIRGKVVRADLPSELSRRQGGSYPQYFRSSACLSPWSNPDTEFHLIYVLYAQC